MTKTSLGTRDHALFTLENASGLATAQTDFHLTQLTAGQSQAFI